jgi:hypothetical protein
MNVSYNVCQAKSRLERIQNIQSPGKTKFIKISLIESENSEEHCKKRLNSIQSIKKVAVTPEKTNPMLLKLTP